MVYFKYSVLFAYFLFILYIQHKSKRYRPENYWIIALVLIGLNEFIMGKIFLLFYLGLIKKNVTEDFINDDN